MKGSTVSHIAVRGASEPPLRAVDVDLPLGRLIALAGPAGSGARALALDVLLAESRRRYIQALSPFEREAVGGAAGAVSLDSVWGLPPATALPGPAAPALTVAGYLHLDGPMAQLLRLRGSVICPECGGTCRSWSAEAGARWAVEACGPGRCLVVAPVELTGSASPAAVAGELQRAGFLRVRVGDEVVRLGEEGGEAALPPGAAADTVLEVVVDRLSLEPAAVTRLTEAVRSARAMARGRTALYPEGLGGPVWLNQQLTCASCGYLNPELTEADLLPGGDQVASLVSLAGQTAREVQGQSLGQALAFWCEALDPHAAPEEAAAAEKAADQATAGGAARALLAPLRACRDLGLGHLPLERRMAALSRGERLLLSVAAAASRELSGILYLISEPLEVLDGPLRAAAFDRLRSLTEAGNTVVILSSRPEVVAACDCALHFRDGAVVAPGVSVELPSRDAAPTRHGDRELILRGPGGRANLRDLDLALPLEALVVFTGPPGSGKTAVVEKLLPELVGSRGRGPRARPPGLTLTDGGLRRILHLGQSPPRGDDTLLEALGLAGHLARLYADTPAATERAYPPEWFLLDRAGGRCTICEGRGVLRWDLEFMEAMTLPCPACEGRRYRREVLEITQRGLAISDVLDLTAAEAASLFERHRRLGPALEAAVRLALGHRRLGSGTDRLDPAEILRLNLAAALPRAGSRDLFTMDHPGAGQHDEDVDHLLRGIDDLVGAGASVWVIDRHPALIEAADAVVEMGPGRGPEGGCIVSVRRR